MAPNIIAFPGVEQSTPFTGKTLFLADEDSGYVKADDVSILFPEATLSVIANAGHWLHVQQPGFFIEQVEKFFVGWVSDSVTQHLQLRCVGLRLSPNPT